MRRQGVVEKPPVLILLISSSYFAAIGHFDGPPPNFR
jgi:hypothetical protein